MAESELSQNTNKKWLQRRWGEEVINCGYAVVPTLLLRHQGNLNLTSTDLVIIANLIGEWYFREDDRLPFIPKKSLERNIGCSETTLRNCFKRLEKLGLLRRIVTTNNKTGGQGANQYDLSGLITRLQEIAAAE